MIATLALALAAALAAQLPTPLNGPCPTARARYALRGDPKISLAFLRYPVGTRDNLSDVYLALHSRHTGTSYWFEFDWGSARIINVYPVADSAKQTSRSSSASGKAPPHDNMTYWPGDRGLNFTVAGPQGAHPAPKYIFIPELENAMWYGAEPREAVPTALFVLKACAKP